MTMLNLTVRKKALSLFLGLCVLMSFTSNLVVAPSNQLVRETFTVTVDDPVFVNVRHVDKAHGPSRGAILMVHGGWHTSFYYDLSPRYSLMNYLARRHFDTFAVDLRGSGSSYRSDLSWFAQITLQDYIADIAAVVSDIQSRGYSQVTIIAHSLGGMVATMYVALYPETVAAYIDMGTPFFEMGLDPGLLAEMQAALQTYPILPCTLEFLDLFFEDVRPRVVKKSWAILQQQFLGQTVGNEILSGVWIPYVWLIPSDIPILLLKGDQDTIQLDRDAQIFLEAFASDDKTLLIMEGYGHNMLLELKAKKVYRELWLWLKTL